MQVIHTYTGVCGIFSKCAPVTPVAVGNNGGSSGAFAVMTFGRGRLSQGGGVARLAAGVKLKRGQFCIGAVRGNTGTYT